MHGGEEIWECVCASIRSSGFFFFWLRDRSPLLASKLGGFAAAVLSWTECLNSPSSLEPAAALLVYTEVLIRP